MKPLHLYIEQTLLKPETTQKQIEELCHQSIQSSFIGICINPGWVSFAKPLAQSKLKIVTVVGFPLGATTTLSKTQETYDAIKNGADEIDMVINIGFLKSGLRDKVEADIKSVVTAAEKKPVKVIIETGLLSESEKILASQICVNAGAAFVKTCTGFSGGQATVSDIKLIKNTIGKHCQIKASGGIRQTSEALALIEAGADRLGTSQGLILIQNNSTFATDGY